MSRMTLVVCLLMTFVGVGCDSGSNFGDEPATSVAAEARPRQEPALPDLKVDTSPADVASDAASTDSGSRDTASAATGPQAPAEEVTSGPSTTAVTNSARRNVKSDSEETLDITFDDIQLLIQADVVFRPFMLTDRVRELDGKRVRISGVMLPDTKTKGIKQFVLLKAITCKFGPGGQADHLVNVLMVDGTDTKYREDPISVEGTLTVNPFTGPDGNTWSIYDLSCDSVTRYHPRR